SDLTIARWSEIRPSSCPPRALRARSGLNAGMDATAMNNEVGPPTPQGPPAALRVLARVEPEWVRGETPPGLGAASPSHEQRPRATSTSLASDRVIAGGRGDTRRSPNGRQDRVRRRVLRPGSRVRLRLARRQDTACPVVLRT